MIPSGHPLWLSLLAAIVLMPTAIPAQELRFALKSGEGLRLINVQADPVRYRGKSGIRVRMSEEARRQVAQQTVQQQSASLEKLTVIDGTDFSSGVIEAEIAGEPEAGAPAGARGFVGIAFRLHPDNKTYDAFYLRPTNGRADDQVRRNHSVQYISHPDWTFARFRRESPERYESYADLVPGAWTKVRIEVRGAQARLFVNGAIQPTLIVNDLKTGPESRGAIALWIDTGTDAHFRNLRVTR